MQKRANVRILSGCLLALAAAGCGATDGTSPGEVDTLLQPASSGASFWTDTDTPAKTSTSTSAHELGLKFTSDTNGTVTAVRFYKAVKNTGSHTGHLWSATGTLLGAATFSDETASGWQTATLSPPVAVTAGTTYVVSYTAPAGFFSYTSQYFATARDVSPLHAPIGAGVYKTGTGFPSATSTNNNYWVDLILEPPPVTEFSFWTDTDTPNRASTVKTDYELGLKFNADTNGSVTAVKFYKALTNNGTHTAHVWSATGTLLATADFTGETASGWQTAPLSSPVATTAGTTYVISYHSVTGFSYNSQYFAAARDLPPLHAPIAAGVYKSGTGFPSATSTNNNYWVDLNWTCAPTCSGVTCGESDGCGGVCCVGSGCSGGATCGECQELVMDSCAGTCVSVTDGTSCTGGTCFAGSCEAGVSTLFGVGSTPSRTYTGAAVELGVRFTSDVAGAVTGLRFYRATGVTGQTGHLWSSTGVLLGTLTFPGGTTAGWQQASFSEPIAINSGETYVASYHTPGKFAFTPNYFTAAVDVPPLHAQMVNDYYTYGADPSYPTRAATARNNYWVDVIFQTP